MAPSTPKAPRHAKTVYAYKGRTYCLQPAAVTHLKGTPNVTVCTACYEQLKKKRLPTSSLVTIDPGPLLTALEPLTWLEAQLVGPLRPTKRVVVLKPPTSQARGSNEGFQKGLRGHVIAVPHVHPAKMVALFPCPLEEIPDIFEVVIIRACKSRGEAINELKSAKTFNVRGKLVVQWARHLAKLLEGNAKFRLDEGALSCYNHIDGVPSSFTENLIFPTTDAEETELNNRFSEKKEGIARTRAGAPEEAAVFHNDGPLGMEGMTLLNYFIALMRLIFLTFESDCLLDVTETPTHAHTPVSLIMDGIDDVDVEIDPVVSDANLRLFQPPPQNTRDVPSESVKTDAQRHLANGAKLVAATAWTNKPFSDYDKEWFLYVHFTSFPHGTGACPAGMTLSRWIKILLNRYPREQFAQNIDLVCNAFDIIQKHEVFTQSHVQMKLAPADVKDIAAMTQHEISLAVHLVKSKVSGKEKREAFEQVTELKLPKINSQ